MAHPLLLRVSVWDHDVCLDIFALFCGEPEAESQTMSQISVSICESFEHIKLCGIWSVISALHLWVESTPWISVEVSPLSLVAQIWSLHPGASILSWQLLPWRGQCGFSCCNSRSGWWTSFCSSCGVEDMKNAIQQWWGGGCLYKYSLINISLFFFF